MMTLGKQWPARTMCRVWDSPHFKALPDIVLHLVPRAADRWILHWKADSDGAPKAWPLMSFVNILLARQRTKVGGAVLLSAACSS